MEKPIIYVIDDEQDISEVCASYLEDDYSAYRFDCAKDALKAIQNKKNRPRAILTAI